MPEKQRLLALALKGLEAERAKLDSEIAEIRTQLGSESTPSTNGSAGMLPATRPRKTMSAEARRKISEAMKRRHAERRRSKKG